MPPQEPLNIGVVNPYALAELKLKRRVNWTQIADPHKVLEDALGMPYEHLFDPKHDSPLYPGMKVNPKTKSLEKVKAAVAASEALVTGVAAMDWVDVGSFFRNDDAAEVMDPIQGARADCYFIAALSSVAWARPYVIAQRTRSYAPDKSLDMIEFHPSGGGVKRIDATEELPVSTPSNSLIYARSGDDGELWPGVYEKAYAMLKGNTNSDHPDYTVLDYGDPVAAEVELTGLTPYYYSTQSMTANDIYKTISESCFRNKTVNPMVAWTYGSGSNSPDNVDYASAHLAANHAYSVMGCQWKLVPTKPNILPFEDRRPFPPISYEAGAIRPLWTVFRHIILRNPWGCYEPSLSPTVGTWTAWDAPGDGGPGFWRPIVMAPNDGMFALEVSDFKKYFAGFGLVR